jgi:hypothetical protein
MLKVRTKFRAMFITLAACFLSIGSASAIVASTAGTAHAAAYDREAAATLHSNYQGQQRTAFDTVDR